jgi:ABC-2 type transport system ATP-binding protein
MIRVEQLRKAYGELVAVDGLSFDVEDGEIFGFLGPNGAGKTTTMSMISGVLRPDGGRVTVNGVDMWRSPEKVKRELGVVPQEISVYEDLSATDNLRFWGSLYGLGGTALRNRVAAALERVGLADRAKDRVKTFSGGMKRRLNLCMGLLHEPRFLLLDEPTVGIDPQARLAILDIVREVASAGTTVIYTTHSMEEAQQLCDRIAIIDHGRLLASGTLAELTRLAGEAEVLSITGSFTESDISGVLGGVPGLRLLRASDGTAVAAVEAGGPGLLQVLPSVLGAGLAVEDVSIQQPNLQNVFIALTGRELRD